MRHDLTPSRPSAVVGAAAILADRAVGFVNPLSGAVSRGSAALHGFVEVAADLGPSSGPTWSAAGPFDLQPMGDAGAVRKGLEGMHAILTLPGHLDEPTAVAAAARRELAVEGLQSCRRGGPNQPPALVVGYGTPPDHAYSGALARLVAALRKD